MAKIRFIEKRLEPSESPLLIIGTIFCSFLLALIIGGILFLPFEVNPLDAYTAMITQSLGTLRGLGYTLVRATPLIFIGLGTIVAWRSGFFYLGFEGTLLVGASMTAWIALATMEDGFLGPLPPIIFFPLAITSGFIAGGLWSTIVGIMRSRFGGNEVIVSLMFNYVAVFLVNYLVTFPMRAPGDLPQTERFPDATILPTIIPDTRAHAGIVLAFVAAILVWLLLNKTRVGFEMIATGLSPRSARYSGINVGNRQILASFIAGGLGAMAGLSHVLGVQFRLLDGISGGTGFVGIVAALLGNLHPIGVVISSFLYAAMGVGADVMQRRMGLPSSVIFIVQGLIVLFVLASAILRYYRINWSALNRKAESRVPADNAGGE